MIGYIFTLALAMALAASGSVAQAQTEEGTEVAEQSEASPAQAKTTDTIPVERIERIEVTGSHIKRIDIEGASPVQTITRKELEKTGQNSVADVLRDVAVNSFGSVREESGSNAAGVAHVNLRGLGSSNTLVLLNGQRLPSDAVTGAVDLNLIPMAAVERIEILKDGASAIYGSDALGGVVNVITRKDFKGTEVSLKSLLPEKKGGAKQEISVVNGVNMDRWNMVNVLYYRTNEKIYSRDRDWSNNGVSLIGSPGSYRNPGASWNADPNCPADQIRVTAAGNFCTFKFSDYSTELPALNQLSFLSETNIEVNAKLRLKARVGLTQKNAQWSYAPAPGSFQIDSGVAAGLGSGGGPLPGTTPGQDVQVRYRLLELGSRDTKIKTDSYNLLLGGTYVLESGWEVQLNAATNKVKNSDKGINGYALTESLTSAIESGAFNPFAPAGQKGSIEQSRYVPEENTVSDLNSAELKVSGELAEWSSGPVGLAVGSQFTQQSYRDEFDEKSVNGEVFGNAGSSGGGDRDTRAVFVEASLPVTTKTEIQLAARYDEYSDFGKSTNPKVALLVHPTPTLLLRASAGTGFKAPLMQDLYAASSQGYPTFIDHVSCAREQAAGGDTSSCSPQQYEVTSRGNPGLKEQKSQSINLGAVYQPTTQFSFGADYFITQMKNVVDIDYGDAILAEQQGMDLAQHGVIVKRDAQGYIESVEAPLQNLAAQSVSGIDLSASWQISKFKIGMEHSQIFSFKEEGFPGTGQKEKIGENAKPPWRNTISLGYAIDDRNSLSLDGVTIASHSKLVKEEGRLPSYTVFDLQYLRQTKDLGSLTLGVKNLDGKTPPLDDSNPNKPLDAKLYDQIGRQYYVGYKIAF